MIPAAASLAASNNFGSKSNFSFLSLGSLALITAFFFAIKALIFNFNFFKSAIFLAFFFLRSAATTNFFFFNFAKSAIFFAFFFLMSKATAFFFLSFQKRNFDSINWFESFSTSKNVSKLSLVTLVIMACGCRPAPRVLRSSSPPRSGKENKFAVPLTKSLPVS